MQASGVRSARGQSLYMALLLADFYRRGAQVWTFHNLHLLRSCLGLPSLLLFGFLTTRQDDIRLNCLPDVSRRARDPAVQLSLLDQVGGDDLLIAAFALRHPLHVLHGECHAFARRRDRAPVERRSRVRGISGSATAATSVFIAPSLVWFGVQSP